MLNVLFSNKQNRYGKSVQMLLNGLLIIMGLTCGSVAWAEMVDRIAAIVNEEIVLLSELDQTLAAYRQKMVQDGVSPAQQDQVLAKQRSVVLDQLINEKLTAQQVARLGLKVNETEVDATIQRIKQANNLTDESFQRMLALDGLNLAAYREKVKQQLLQNRLVNQEVKSKIVITEQDVKAYYANHQDQFVSQPQYHLRQILMKTDPTAGETGRQSVLENLRKVRDRLVTGEEFAHLAELYSQSPTAANGGDLGLFEARLLAPQIRQALEGLEAGQFTSIIESEQGYQILWVEELVKGSGKSIAEATPEIQEKLYAEVIEQKFQSWLKELRKNAHIQVME